MQKLIVYLLTFISLINVKAQNSLDTQLKDAKFDIIKKTVEFLSTDAAIYKNVNTTTCPDCKNLDDLKKFATTNGLLNADKKIIEPLGNISLDTAASKWQAGLLKFKQQAIDKITGADKERRKSLPGYNKYEQTLNDICSAVKAGNIDETATASVATNADTATAANNSPVKSNSSFTVPLWLLYGIIAILAALSIYTWLENKKNKQAKNSLQDDNTNLKSNWHEAKQEVSRLKNKIGKLEKEAKDRELDIKTYEDRLTQFENEKNQLPQSNSNTESVKASSDIVMEKVISPKLVNTAQAASAIVTKYSRYADLGDGFSNAELLDSPDGETIFELTISPNNTGIYKVVNNPDGQKYALSNAQYFLAKSCRYDSFPAGNTRIQTDEPGLIKLTAGKWTITNPAKISFS